MKNELYEIELERCNEENVIAFARSTWADGALVSTSRQRYPVNTELRSERIFRLVHRSNLRADFAHVNKFYLSIKLAVPCKN